MIDAAKSDNITMTTSAWAPSWFRGATVRRFFLFSALGRMTNCSFSMFNKSLISVCDFRTIPISIGSLHDMDCLYIVVLNTVVVNTTLR